MNKRKKQRNASKTLPLHTLTKGHKKTRIRHQQRKLGEERPGLHCKSTTKIMITKIFFEKVFSLDRMEPYFKLYPGDEKTAIKHYECNIKLSEACYVFLSVLEVALRNAMIRELVKYTGSNDWYNFFLANPKLRSTHRYIREAEKHIIERGETVSPAKMNAEFTLGFWVSLLNSEHEKQLWKSLRKAFPNMPKPIRKRKNVSAPLNRMRAFRNRVFHNESICWNLVYVEKFHREMLKVMDWINQDLVVWETNVDRFDNVCSDIRKDMNWI